MAARSRTGTSRAPTGSWAAGSTPCATARASAIPDRPVSSGALLLGRREGTIPVRRRRRCPIRPAAFRQRPTGPVVGRERERRLEFGETDVEATFAVGGEAGGVVLEELLAPGIERLARLAEQLEDPHRKLL